MLIYVQWSRCSAGLPHSNEVFVFVEPFIDAQNFQMQINSVIFCWEPADAIRRKKNGEKNANVLMTKQAIKEKKQQMLTNWTLKINHNTDYRINRISVI